MGPELAIILGLCLINLTYLYFGFFCNFVISRQHIAFQRIQFAFVWPAIFYLEQNPAGKVLITSLEAVSDAIKGKAGTVITA